MEKLNFGKNNLRKFGITMGIVFLVIASFIFIKRHQIVVSISVISLGFFILALLIPARLKPIYCLWMRFAAVLSWINTRLILVILFYFVFTPMGLAMRVFGMDALDRKIDRSKDSYWKKKEKKDFNPLDYERQF